ncbi:MAG: tetratricopeptide repeat protein [Nostoc sp.]
MNQNDLIIAQKAETLRLSKAYEDAIKIFEELLKCYPDNAWVNAHLGATYYELMNYGEAECYLKKAIEKNDLYLWAHAQLGETYRLRAIAENRKKQYIDLAIEHFNRALNAKTIEEAIESNYAWALAHLGAIYRLKMTSAAIESQSLLTKDNIDKQSKKDALKCFNRAIELISTYAWAWGMRATVYRLAQEYEDSFWDLEVETVIAPEIGVLQNSSSPVPFLETRRTNLHEHALLSFYLTKKEVKNKDKHYGRAIAFAQQALILQPGDLIALLILTVIEANQKKEQQGGSLPEDDKKNIEAKLKRFFEDGELEFPEICKKVLRHIICVPPEQIEEKINNLKMIRNTAGEKDNLTQLILNDVIDNPRLNVGEEPQLWLWKNYALTQTCSNVFFLLSDINLILKGGITPSDPYLTLAMTINPYYAGERLYQTPVSSNDERSKRFKKSFVAMALKLHDTSTEILNSRELTQKINDD